MGFRELLRKEMRECLPWVAGVAAAGTLVGGGRLWSAHARFWREHAQWRPRLAVGMLADDMLASGLSGAGVALFVAALVLGVILAARQFLHVDLARGWGFLLHRPLSRASVLGAKLATAAMGLALVGCGWSLLYGISRIPGVALPPPSGRVFAEGWLLVAWGGLLYLGAVLSCLSPGRWYTRLVGPSATALWILLALLACSTLSNGCFYLMVGLLVLGLQVVSTFLRREF